MHLIITYYTATKEYERIKALHNRLISDTITLEEVSENSNIKQNKNSSGEIMNPPMLFIKQGD